MNETSIELTVETYSNKSNRSDRASRMYFKSSIDSKVSGTSLSPSENKIAASLLKQFSTTWMESSSSASIPNAALAAEI
jgi:hypothetical protein